MDEFVASFSRFCDADTIFVATVTMRPAGLETPFSIMLADRTPALRGFGVVTDAWSSPVNPFRRPGIRIKILKLTRDSIALHARLRAKLAENPAPKSPPRFEAAGSVPRPFEDEISRGFEQRPEPAAFVKPRTVTMDAPPSDVAEIVDTPPPPPAELDPPSARAPSPTKLPHQGAASPRPVNAPRGLPTLIEPDAPAPLVVDVPGHGGVLPLTHAAVTEAPKPAPIEPPQAAVKPMPIASIARKATATPSPLPKLEAPKLEAKLPPLVESTKDKRIDATMKMSALGEQLKLPAKPAPRLAATPAPITEPKPAPILELPKLLPAVVTPRAATVDLAKPPSIAAPVKPLPVAATIGAATPSPVVEPPKLEAKPVLPEAPAVIAEPQPVLVEPPKPEPKPAPPRKATEPIFGERAPASEFVLPANPLMNLTDESLEGFIECTLYEAPAHFVIEELTPLPGPRPMPESPLTSAVMEAVQAPAPVAPYSAYPPGPPLAAVSPLPAEIIAGEISMPPERQPPLAPEPEPPALAYTPPVSERRTPLPFAMDVPPEPVYAPPPVESDAEPAYVTAPLPYIGEEPIRPTPSAFPDPRLATPVPFPRSIPRRYLVSGGVALGMVLAVLIPVIALSGSEDEAHEQPQATPAPPPEPPSPVVKPPPPKQVTVPADDETETAGDPASGPPVVGKGPCRVTVIATPAGSEITVDGQVLGPAPLTFDGPCTKRKIDLAHPRYARATRWVEPTAEPQTLDITLVRPTHSVLVVTVPPGAEIAIDGRRAGTSPTVVKVMGYQGVNITATRRGYKPITKRVYSKVPNDRVTLLLPSVGPKK